MASSAVSTSAPGRPSSSIRSTGEDAGAPRQIEHRAAMEELCGRPAGARSLLRHAFQKSSSSAPGWSSWSLALRPVGVRPRRSRSELAVRSCRRRTELAVRPRRCQPELASPRRRRPDLMLARGVAEMWGREAGF
jgi:hypothetical protein